MKAVFQQQQDLDHRTIKKYQAFEKNFKSVTVNFRVNESENIFQVFYDRWGTLVRNEEAETNTAVVAFMEFTRSHNHECLNRMWYQIYLKVCAGAAIQSVFVSTSDYLFCTFVLPKIQEAKKLSTKIEKYDLQIYITNEYRFQLSTQ